MEALLSEADTALHGAKANRRNRVEKMGTARFNVEQRGTYVARQRRYDYLRKADSEYQPCQTCLPQAHCTVSVGCRFVSCCLQTGQGLVIT